MYCINCGVKLEDTESRCPLCGVTVYHPELTRQTAEPLYPRHRYPAPEAASKAAHIVVSTLMAIALLTRCLLTCRSTERFPGAALPQAELWWPTLYW